MSDNRITRKNACRSKRSLTFENLDQRLTMDATAVANPNTPVPWSNLSALTFSFAPDGTRFNDTHSQLFSVLGSIGSPAEWESTVQEAFDAWLNPLGINIGQRSDFGTPFGSFGPTTGDNRFGDIRFGAVPMTDNVYAEAIPHTVMNQGTWAGDIFLNSNYAWTSRQQLLEVALHEIGHVLGLQHSVSTDSIMYPAGLRNLNRPSANDIASLQKFYTGVVIDSSDHGDGGSNQGNDNDWNEEPVYSFDPTKAIDLTFAAGTTARVETFGELTDASSTQLYRLMPLGEIDHLAFLNLSIAAKDYGGLMPAVELFDAAGDRVPINYITNTAGLLIVQAKDVEPTNTYFVVVKGAAGPTANQIGKFDFYAEYAANSNLPTKIGQFTIGAATPAVEQTIETTTSRLVHLLVKAKGIGTNPSKSAVWLTLVDSQDRILTKLALPIGTSRSAPLVFIGAGSYRIILTAGVQGSSVTPNAMVELYLDEVSVDIGATLKDPLKQPMIDSTGNTQPPVVVNTPVYPSPGMVPSLPSPPPWTSPTWHFWPAVIPSSIRTNLNNHLDTSGNGTITALDALVVINALNQGVSDSKNPTTYLDATNDGALTPLDALIVINYLNTTTHGEGENNVTAAPASDLNQVLSAIAIDFLDKKRMIFNQRIT